MNNNNNSMNLRKLFDYFRKKFRFILLIIVLIILYLIIENLPISNLPNWAIIVFSLLFYVYVLLIMIFFIVVIDWSKNQINKLLYSKRFSVKKSLYTWLTEDLVAEKFIYSLFEEQASVNEIENLRRVKELLKKELNFDLYEYKLFRNHLEFKTKKSFFKKFNLFLLSTLSSAFTLYVLPKYQDKIIDKISREILNFFSIDLNYYFFNIIIYVSFIVFAYFISYNLFLMFTDTNRRIKYLITIIDLMIDEEQNK